MKLTLINDLHALPLNSYYLDFGCVKAFPYKTGGEPGVLVSQFLHECNGFMKGISNSNYSIR